jgi:hypothetical protein
MIRMATRWASARRAAALASFAPHYPSHPKVTNVGFRYACDKKLRNALIDFADDCRHASPWAAKVYNDAITYNPTSADRR